MQTRRDPWYVYAFTMRFASSERSTLGVEWELGIVDAESRELTGIGPELISRLGDERFTKEFLTNTVELVTGVHRSAGSAVDELRGLRDSLLTAADAAGAGVIGSGTHPFSKWREQQRSPGERYRLVTERSGRWGGQLAIWGVHTHIGVEDCRKVPAIMRAALANYPLMLALSTSSPYWQGEDTTFSSHRTMIFRQLPTGGLPPEMETWEDYERVAHDVLHTGIVDEVQELRWDVRPSAHWGTVEIRVSDGATNLRELGAMVALNHVIVEHASRQLDAGRDTDRLPSWFVRENKWRAARYGLDAIIIEDAAGNERPVTEVLAERIEGDYLQVAEDLGCTEELGAIAEIIESGSSSDRQRRVAEQHDGALVPVVDSLIAELKA